MSKTVKLVIYPFSSDCRPTSAYGRHVRARTLTTNSGPIRRTTSSRRDKVNRVHLLLRQRRLTTQMLPVVATQLDTDSNQLVSTSKSISTNIMH